MAGHVSFCCMIEYIVIMHVLRTGIGFCGLTRYRVYVSQTFSRYSAVRSDRRQFWGIERRPAQYLDMSVLCSVAKVARMNVRIISLKIILELKKVKQTKMKKIACSLRFSFTPSHFPAHSMPAASCYRRLGRLGLRASNTDDGSTPMVTITRSHVATKDHKEPTSVRR